MSGSVDEAASGRSVMTCGKEGTGLSWKSAASGILLGQISKYERMYSQ